MREFDNNGGVRLCGKQREFYLVEVEFRFINSFIVCLVV